MYYEDIGEAIQVDASSGVSCKPCSTDIDVNNCEKQTLGFLQQGATWTFTTLFPDPLNPGCFFGIFTFNGVSIVKVKCKCPLV